MHLNAVFLAVVTLMSNGVMPSFAAGGRLTRLGASGELGGGKIDTEKINAPDTADGGGAEAGGGAGNIHRLAAKQTDPDGGDDAKKSNAEFVRFADDFAAEERLEKKRMQIAEADADANAAAAGDGSEFERRLNKTESHGKGSHSSSSSLSAGMKASAGKGRSGRRGHGTKAPGRTKAPGSSGKGGGKRSSSGTCLHIREYCELDDDCCGGLGTVICDYERESDMRKRCVSVADPTTEPPTELPTEPPTEVPTELPTELPTLQPSVDPSESPSEAPSDDPTSFPTDSPSSAPSRLCEVERADEDLLNNYTITENYNCGWDPNSTVDENNSHKYVCTECTNNHTGVDVESIEECETICNNATFSDCGGFAFFGTGVTGADGLSHGSGNEKDIGSCYFRNADWTCKGSAKEGVDCYIRS